MFSGAVSAVILGSIRGRLWSEISRTRPADSRPFRFPDMKCRSTIRVRLALLLALASGAIPAWGAQAPRTGQSVVIDRIVAIVNDEAITARELDERTQYAMK